jgi:antitoxin VapB
MSDLAVAKVFMNGRSQAVRLPKEFRFDTDEVTVERVGDSVILRPRRCTREAWWVEMMSVIGRFEGMPEEIERNQSLPRDLPNFD